MNKPSKSTERADKVSYWQPHVDAWKNSQSTVKAFCIQHSLNYDQFKYWQHQLAPETKNSRRSLKPKQPDFVELIPSSQSHSVTKSASSMTVTKHSIKFEIPLSISKSDLTQLLSVIKEL